MALCLDRGGKTANNTVIYVTVDEGLKDTSVMLISRFKPGIQAE
jgi:hypothetical protein